MKKGIYFNIKKITDIPRILKKLQKKNLNDELLYIGHTLTNEKPNYQIVELITC